MICTRPQFNSEACPPETIYGNAVAYTPLFDQPLSGPLYLRLWVYTSRRGRQRGDWDNLSKAICDGMTGVCFQDDSQIEDARVQLRHVPVGSESVDVEVGVIG